MIKTFEKYLIKLFLTKILNISLIFFSLVFILSIFEEISFFQKSDVNFFLPFLLTVLNTPSTLFEIFPFIFLISSQFFFLELINKNELEVLKTNGLDNFKVIRILFFSSFILGLILVIFYYNFASKLKFLYFDLKNSHSNDNKYLAVVTENGLWFKDEIDDKIYIINANTIEKKFLKKVSIYEFDANFNLLQTFDSEKVDVSNKKWVIQSPIISINNLNSKVDEDIKIITHFDLKKINSMFDNLSSLNIIELNKLIQDYDNLGYSTNEADSHLHRLYSFPIFVSTMTILASIIMFNIKRNKPLIFHIIIGIFLSVLIYYLYYLFGIMGQNGKIPLLSSIWLPLLILTIINFIGLVRINEK
tara:strand:- start:278 stop:1357 length:1080 start_codon:yes stop_codon:yes gene_type:complete